MAQQVQILNKTMTVLTVGCFGIDVQMEEATDEGREKRLYVQNAQQ